jgi:hypothetical protein
MSTISNAKKGTFLIEDDGTYAQYSFESLASGGNPDPESNTAFTPLSNVQTLLDGFMTDKPIAMLPVKLETKFINNDLWIRIFPDRIFIKSLEKKLTPVELASGQEYWNSYYSAQSLAQQQEAWRKLCVQFGTTRAAWIIRELFPTNLEVPGSNVNIEHYAEKLGNIQGTNEAFLKNYIGPEGAISKMLSYHQELTAASQNVKALSLNNGETAVFKTLSNIILESYQSVYNSIVNPVLNSKTLSRADKAFTKYHMNVLNELIKLKTPKIENPEVKKVTRELFLYTKKIQKFNSLKSKRKNPDSLMEEVYRCVVNSVEKLNGIQIAATEISEILKIHSDLSKSILLEYDNINPYIDINKPDSGRQYKSADINYNLILQELENLTKATYYNNAGIIDSQKILRTLEAKIVTLKYDHNKPDPVLIVSYYSQLEKILDDYFDSISKVTLSPEEAVETSSFFNKLKSKLNFQYDYVVNPFNIGGVPISGRQQFPKAEYVWGLLNKKIASIDTYFNSNYLSNNGALFDATSTLKNAFYSHPDLKDKDKFVRDTVKRTFDDVLNNMADKFGDDPVSSLALTELCDSYEKYNKLYNEYLNPPRKAGLPTLGGQSSTLDSLHRQTKYSFYSCIEKCLKYNEKAQSAFNDLTLSEKSILTYKESYTTPQVVTSSFSQLKVHIDEAKKLITGNSFSASEKSFIQDLAEKQLELFIESLETSYSPISGDADSGIMERNPEISLAANDIIEALEEVIKTGNEAEITPFPSTFTFSGPPEFPEVIIHDAPEVQPFSDVLPTHFVAIGFNEEEDINTRIKFIKAGLPVSPNIRFGFDPGFADLENENALSIDPITGEVIADVSMRWLINKEQALEDGLAIKVPVGANTYFSKIVVFGLHQEIDPSADPIALEDLFLNHQYTTGLSLLDIGTSTNNTETEDSGYNTNEGHYIDSFNTFASQGLYSPTTTDWDITDGQRFAEALGLPYSALDHVNGVANKSITNGHVGGKVLYPGTMGVFVEELMDNIFNQENRLKIRDFFEKHVSARGIAPAFRIGKQPYGLLVTSNLHSYKIQNEIATENLSIDDFMALNPYGEFTWNTQGWGSEFDEVILHRTNPDVFTKEQWQLRFDRRLKQVLQHLDLEWRKLAQRFSKNMYKENILFQEELINKEIDLVAGLPYANYGQLHFIHLLNTLPYSKEFAVRYAINSNSWDIMAVVTGENFMQSYIDTNPVFPFQGWPLLCGLVKKRVKKTIETNGWEKVHQLMANTQKLDSGIYTYPDYPSLDYPSPLQIIDPSIPENGTYSSLERKLNNTRAFFTTNAHEYTLLTGSVVSSSLENDNPYVYLNWLLEKTPNIIFGNNQFDGFPSRSILFLEARNSILAKYREIAMQMFVDHDLADWPSLSALGSPEKGADSWSSVMFQGLNTYPEDRLDINIENDETVEPELANFQTVRWEMTKWNLLLGKLYGNTPWFMFPAYKIESANFPDSYNSWSRADMDWLDVESDRSEDIVSETYRPWRDSELLRYLVPAVSPGAEFYKFGIFEVPRIMTTDDRRTLGDYLFDPSQQSSLLNSTLKNDLKKYKDAIAYMANLSVAELERIVGENADLSSSRLDAWIHGLYKMRLEQMRNRKKKISKYYSSTIEVEKGCYVGAYGYVENLQRVTLENAIVNSKPVQKIKDDTDPTNDKMKISKSDLPAEFIPYVPDGTSVYIDNANKGFIVAPTITHAVTAAILRSGYIASRELEESQVYNRSSVNLSSARIRSAIFLLQGIQAGNDLGALLGAQFENGLHESSGISVDGIVPELDYNIHRLRKIFPLSTSIDTSTENTPVGGEVLDGLALLSKVKELIGGSIQPTQSIYEYLTSDLSVSSLLNINNEEINNAIPTGNSNKSKFERKVIAYHIDQMAQSLDALGDLVVTEGVYQIARSNTARASAFMDTMTGKAPIMEPEFIQSPIKVNQLTNRLIFNYEPVELTTSPEIQIEPASNTFWTLTVNSPLRLIDSPRSILDPSLNKWLVGMLPNGISVRVHFLYKVASDSEWENLPIEVVLTELNIQPLDIIALLAPDPSDISLALEKRLVYEMRIQHPEYFDIKLDINNLDCNAGETAFGNCIPLLCELRKVLDAAKTMEPRDFNSSETEDALSSIDRSDYISRLDHCYNLLQNLGASLLIYKDLEIINFGENEFNAAQDLIAIAIKLSLNGIIPDSARAWTDCSQEEKDKTLQLAKVAHTLVADRLSRLSGLWTIINDSETTNSKVLACGNEFLTFLFGSRAYCFPKLELDSNTEIVPAINGSSNLLSGSETPIYEKWIHANGMIRKNLSHYINLQLAYELSNADGTKLSASVVQVPYANGDKWLGLPKDSWAETLPTGKACLLLTNPELINTNSITGFKLDEWNEALPEEEVVSGIAMHFNQPGNEAPQNILLVLPVTNEEGETWKVDDLIHSITQAFDMAKYRALEPENIGQTLDNDDPADENNVVPVTHWGKIFPANMGDVFPVSNPVGTPLPYDYDGLRVSFDYTENNEN